MSGLARVVQLERALRPWIEGAFLSFVRLYWGYGFAVTGLGKLGRLDEVAAWFGDDLHLPFPYANAVAAALTELIGGVLLLLGLGTRVATVPLVVVMVVAYLTADFGGLESFWLSEAACTASKTCVPFEEAAPFSYLWAALIVLLWGPGPLSLDRVLRWR